MSCNHHGNVLEYLAMENFHFISDQNSVIVLNYLNILHTFVYMYKNLKELETIFFILFAVLDVSFVFMLRSNLGNYMEIF